MKTLLFKVEGQRITRIDNIIPVAKCRNLYKAHFDFLTPEWEGTKTAIFSQRNYSKAQILDEKNECMIPWEFFDTEINIRGSVTVFCGDLVTANSTYVDIEKAGYQNSDATVPPTPDVHQQMIDILNAAKKIAQGVRDDADAGKFHGENGESAYQIAIRLGFRGTEQEWIESLEYDHSEEFTKLAEEVRNTASNIAAERQQITQSSEDIARLKEEIVELTPIIGDEYEAYDISYEFNKMGFINNNGNITHSSTSRYTEHIPVRANDMFYYKLVEDNKNSYGIAIYDNDKNFIKGYKISTPETTYRIIKGSFVVTEGSFIKFSSLNATDENLAPLLYVKKNKSNEHSFKKYKEVYGDVEYKFLDISNDLHEICDKYLNVSGDAIDYPNQNSFVTDYYDVEEGEIYKYVTRALHKNPSYVVYDKHRRLIDKGGTISGINTGDIVIPPMGAYIRFNKMSDTSNVFKVSKKIPKPLAEVIDDKITVKSMDIPAKHTELQVNIMNGFLNESNIINGDTEDSEYVHTDYINISEYKWFNTHVHYGWAAVGYLLLDENKIVLYALKSSTGKDEKIILQTKDILSKYPKAKYIRFVGEKIGKKSLKVFVNHKTTDYDLALETVISKSNMLYNKKIAFCGDSFTEASNLGDNYYDAYYGCYKSYGWRIADRNGMRLYHDGISGSTMHVVDIATPTERRPFAYERYKKVPKDCDYIILQFGLNESSIAASSDTKGTKESTDTSTMWGSWNVVLEYLITNHPKARIGVIMSDAWMPQSYYETLKEICEWWGIPLLDLGGDANIPVMNSGRRVGCGLTLNPKVTELRNREFYQNFESGDAHPNDAGHEWRSTVIEDFIRRL